MSGRVTLSGRNNMLSPRSVYLDDVLIGHVRPFRTPGVGVHWGAFDKQGRSHGDRYISDWAAADALSRGYKVKNPAGLTVKHMKGWGYYLVNRNGQHVQVRIGGRVISYFDRKTEAQKAAQAVERKQNPSWRRTVKRTKKARKAMAKELGHEYVEFPSRQKQSWIARGRKRRGVPLAEKVRRLGPLPNRRRHYSTIYEGPNGVYFVTSEQPPHGGRIFFVRKFHPDTARIERVGQSWDLSDARQQAKEMAGTAHRNPGRGRRRNPVKPAGFKTESSGTLWYKEYTSLRAAEKKLQELLHKGYRANINFLGGKHRVRVGMDDGPEYNPSIRRYKKGRLSGFEAATGRAVKFFRRKGSATRKARRSRRTTRSNPAYAIRESFGGKPLGIASSLESAKSMAKTMSMTQPVDVWSTSGGRYGQGEVVWHYADGKGTRMGRRSRRTRTNPTERYQIRAAGRIFTVSAKTKAAAQAEVQKYCRQHGLVVRNGSGSIRKTKKRTRAMGATHYQAGPYRGHQTKFKKFKPQRTMIGGRHVTMNRKRTRNRKKSVSMLVPRSTRRTIKAVERRTSKALSRYLGGSR